MAERELPVPLVDGMIHRPGVPRHMMRAKRFARPVRIERHGALLAQTGRALQLVEIGRDLYEPVWYVPMDDVGAALVASGKSTHCPLKGDTTYYDLADGSGDALAWSYTDPLPFAQVLAGHVAFDAARVTIVLLPEQEPATDG